MRSFFAYICSIPVIVFASYLSAPTAHAVLSNGANAIDLLGQYDTYTSSDFTPVYGTANANSAPNAIGFGSNSPYNLAFDGTNHRLFVADPPNNRILVYNLTAGNLLTDHIADNVIGQANFYATSSAITQAGLYWGTYGDIAVDLVNNRLYASQYNGNRVTVYDTTTITNGENAVNVLGQTTFSGSTAATTQPGMYNPTGVAVDSVNNRLYVAARTNHRVTVYDTTTISNGENAVNVLGQTTFSGSTGASSQPGLNYPQDLAVDSNNNRLYVAEEDNYRVTVFDTTTITNGENAVNVLGQSGFGTPTSAATQPGMTKPKGAVIDSANNRLYVSQIDSNRITVYDVSTITNGENAVNVLGQTTFNGSGSGTTQPNLQSPRGIVLDTTNSRLYVADKSNGRVVVYDVTAITNGENAVDLLGQYDTYTSSDFTPVYGTANANSAPNAIGMSAPYGIAFDGTNHRLFVSDGTNNRVLVYNLNTNNTLADHIADNVIGQPDFYTVASASTQPGLNKPQGIAYDSINNRLYVAENSNQRVTVFNTSSITNGMNAVNVLGQTTFSGSGAVTDQVGFWTPTGVVIDTTNNRLYVGDSSNNRVKIYDTSSITNGMNAVNVLGQTTFSGGTATTTQLGLSGPRNLAFDSANNRLYVAEQNNNRVTVYDTSSITNGMNAVNVLGQTGFGTGTSANSQPGLQLPFAVALDSANNRLYVSAATNNRVTVYDTSSITNGMNAVNVLGQTAFDGSSAATTQAGLKNPRGLAVDTTNTRLYVGDLNNNRVSVFDVAPPPTISGTVYSDEGTTPLTSKTIAISINGASAATTADTDSNGAYSLTGLSVSAGDVITLYLDGETEKAVTVTQATGSDQTSVNLYADRLITRCDNSSCSLTNANLETAETNADADITSIYSVASSNLTLASGKHLFIPSSHTFAPGGNINLSGNWTNNGSFTESTHTVTFDGSSAQALTGETFYNLTINNSAASPDDSTDVDSSAAVTVTNTLTVSDGQFSPTTASDFAGVTISTNGILKPDSGAAITVSSDWANTGIFTHNDGTVTFDGSTAQAVTGDTFYNLTINNSAASPDDSTDVDSSAAVTVTNTLTVTDGQFQPTTASSFAAVSIGANGILKPDSGASITDSGTWTNSGTFTPNSGTLTLTGTLTFSDTTSLYNLTINGSGQTVTLGAALTTTNTLTITAGTLDVSASGCSSASCAVSVGGNFSNAGTYTPRSNTTTLTGTGSQTLTSGGTSFYNLTQNSSGGTYTLQDALDVDSNLTITAGTLADGGFATSIGGNYSNAGSYTGTGTVTFDASSGTQTLTSGGTGTTQDFQNISKTTGGTLQFATNSVDIDGTLTIAASTIVDINALNLTADTLVNNGTLLADGSETITITTKDTDSGAVKYDGSGSYTTALSYGNTYYDVEFAGSGVWEPSAAVTINRNLTITSGTFDIDGQALTVTGTFSNAGTVRLLGTETLSLTPDTDSGTISYDNSSALTDFPSPLNDTYYNLTLEGSGTVTLAANLTTNNNLTISSGATLSVVGYDLTVTGNLINSGTISNAAARTITLSGTTQTFTPSNITLGTLSLTGSSGTVSLGSNFTLGDLLSITAGRTLSLLSYILTGTSTPITNLGTINEGTGAIIRSSSNLYIADSNFDEDDAISLGTDSVYVSITDEDGNLNGTSADTLSGVVVSCSTDSETVSLTETGAATEVFRNAGLTTALYAGSNTNNNGTLTCSNAATITATYTDPQDGTDTRSDTATATSDTIPTAPSSFAGSAPSSTSITWTWTDNSSDETGFKLYDSSNTLIATISTANTTSYTETGLTKGVVYTRKLAAYNNAGNSSYSGSASVTTPAEPTAPSSFAGTAASNTSITWTWNDNSSDEVGFRLLDADGTTIATIATAGTTSYTETGLTKNTSYTRKVVAYNDDGTSTASSTATVSTSNASPAAFSLVSPADNALSDTGLPTFSFKKSSETGGSIASYTLFVGDLSFTGIPANGSSASNPVSKTDYENTFTAQYFSEDDGNDTNDYIVVTLKDGSTSLPLIDGKYVWYVKAIDAEGASTISEDRTIIIDATKPTISDAKNITTSETRPTIVFTANDSYGLKELTLTLEQAKTSLSAITSYTALQTTTYTLTGKSQQISFIPKNNLAAGKYRYTITVTDVTGHETTNTFTLTVLSAEQQASEAIAQLNPESDTPDTIIETLRSILPDTPINIPALQEKAVVRRQAQAENFSTFLQKLRYTSIPGEAALERALASIFGRFRIVRSYVVARVQSATNSLAFIMPRIALPNFIHTGRDTRIRQGLAHRQMLSRGIQRVLTPVKSFGLHIALRIRASYEIWIDDTPTKISNLAMTNISPTTVTINWDTNHVTHTGKVNYGTSTSYNQEKFEEDGLRDHHSVTLENLTPQTTYYFEVMNQNGGYVYDAYYTVTTPAEDGVSSTNVFVPQIAIIQREKPVPVYKEPTPTSEVVKTLLPGARLRALTEQGSWISVLLNTGQEVWLEKEHIKLIPQEGDSGSAQH